MWVHRTYIWNRYARGAMAVANLSSIAEGVAWPEAVREDGREPHPAHLRVSVVCMLQRDQPQPVFPPQFGQT
jgi:hypothetical protein